MSGGGSGDRVGRQALQHGQAPGHGVAQFAAVADEVHGALGLQEFGTLEAFRQRHAHRGFDHARPREADERLGLGDHDIAHEGETGRDATHGRVGQHADVGQALLGQPRERRIGLGHLHERQQAFLHARAARGGEADERHFLLDGGFHAAHEALAHHAAHGAAHEVELEAGRDDVDALDRAAHHDQRVGLAGVLQRFLQAFGVLAAVLELERVHRQHFLADLVAAFRVQEGVEARAGIDAVVVAAMRADVLIVLQIGLVEHGLAARALDPQPLGHLAALRRVGLLDLGRQKFFEPGHWCIPQNEWQTAAPQPSKPARPRPVDATEPAPPGRRRRPPSRAKRERRGKRQSRSGGWSLILRVERLAHPPQEVHGQGHDPLVGLVVQQLDDAAADHHGIRDAADGLRGGRIADAETHADGDVHMAADHRQHGFHGRGVEGTRSGHALERDVIYVAARDARHLLHALLRAGGRQQEDQVHAMRAQPGSEVLAFFGGVVHDQHPVHAGLGRVAHEGVLAVALVVALHRVGVAHEHHRGLRVALAELAHVAEHLGHAHAQGEGLFPGLLDHRAVGHGVGERNAELDHVGAGLHHAVHQRRRDVREREAGGHVGDEGLAAAGLQVGERRPDAALGGHRRCRGRGGRHVDAHAAGPPLTAWPRMDGRS